MQTLLANLKSLASDRRLVIIKLLERRERTVNELAHSLHLTHPTISYHLRKLYREKYVSLHKRGKYAYYSLSPLLKNKSILNRIECWQVNKFKHVFL